MNKIREFIEKMKETISSVVNVIDEREHMFFPELSMGTDSERLIYSYVFFVSPYDFFDVRLAEGKADNINAKLAIIQKELVSVGINTTIVRTLAVSDDGYGINIGYLQFKGTFGRIEETKNFIPYKEAVEFVSSILPGFPSKKLKVTGRDAVWRIIILLYPSESICKLMKEDMEDPGYVTEGANPEAFALLKKIFR